MLTAFCFVINRSKGQIKMCIDLRWNRDRNTFNWILAIVDITWILIMTHTHTYSVVHPRIDNDVQKMVNAEVHRFITIEIDELLCTKHRAIGVDGFFLHCIHFIPSHLKINWFFLDEMFFLCKKKIGISSQIIEIWIFESSAERLKMDFDSIGPDQAE